MLVLSREKDESIVIGGCTATDGQPCEIPATAGRPCEIPATAGRQCGIVVTVVEIRGDKVRLGIDAPKHIPVHRKEVWLAIQRQGSTIGTGTSTTEARS